MADNVQVPQPVEPASFADGKRSLGNHLKQKFTTYKTDRRVAEQQWMQNVRQYLGKYDADYEGKMAQDTSRAYPKRTRVKCVSMRGRLMDLLFPASEKNWSVGASPVPTLPKATLVLLLQNWQVANPGKQPTLDQLNQLVTDTSKAMADKQEALIDDQLKDIDPYGAGDYEALCGKVVDSAVRYGPGVIKGPTSIKDTATTFQIDAAGVPQVVESDTFRPFFEFVPCWDYYPDMSAKEFAQMEGEFQRHVYSKQQLTQLAKRADFDGDLIRDYIRANPQGDYTKQTYESEMDTIAGAQGANQVPKGSKYELLEFWGSTSAQRLRDAGVEVDAGLDEDEDVRFTAWVLGDYAIKANINPFPYGTKVYHQFVFENDEINLLGSGLPPIMRDSQLAVASFSRMLVDNASTVCGPNVEVDTDKLSPSMTDLTIKPFRVWLTERTNGGQAVRSVSFDSHINELLAAIATFDKFADGETFVNPATGGDMDGVSGEAFRTTGGASMIYGNAALPFKDIVRNFDQFTVSVIHSLIQWNKIFHDDRDQLQGDVRPIARGATSLMAKEMRSFAMDNLAQTMSDQERAWINTPAMLAERLKVRDLSPTDLLLSKEQYQQQQDQQAQAQAQAQQQQAALLASQIKNMDASTVKDLSQAQKNLDGANTAAFKAITEALKNGTDPTEIAAIAERAAGRSALQSGQPTAVNDPTTGQPPQAANG